MDIKQKFIINLLEKTYSSVYFVSVAERMYKRITEREMTVLSAPSITESGKWDEGYGAYLNGFVDEPYREKMRVFLEVEKYEERLGDNTSVSLEYQRKDAGWRKAFMFPAERDENGRITSVIFAVQPIDTEKTKELETQKALKEAYEAAQLANRAKTSFLSNMSHDIRTPINAIVGMTAIAAANIENTDKVSYCLKKITESSKHLLGLINEILDMSKIESGKIDLNEEPFDISDLIDEVVSMNQPQIKEKSHTLKVNTVHISHERVIGDFLRLQQVFNNLLSNAIKYTPSGGVIEITISEKDTQTPSVGRFEAEISDNGIGMSEEDIAKIFDSFTRSNDERVSNIQGTGLGMPIARSIIRMMNGDITIKSRINQGSTFKVEFSLKLANEENTIKSDKLQELIDVHNLADFNGKRILLAEDNDINAEITVELLKMLKLKIDVADNGKACFEKFHNSEKGYYDLIFMDVQMPYMDGYQATAAIRASDHLCAKTIPIVAMTANAFSTDVVAALNSGMNEHIAKPIEMDKLIKTLKKYLS